jgi:hypothetical protein
VKLRRFASCCALFSASVLCAQHASVPDGANKEEIYVFRSVRTSRVPPTDYAGVPEPVFPRLCSRIGTFFTR